MSELFHLVLRLREEHGFSRNRRYDELSHPLAARARRIARRLRGIERELRACSRVEVSRDPSGYLIRCAFPAVRLSRQAHLTHEEHTLLCRDPALASLLIPSD